MLELNNLTAGYGKSQVIFDLSLAVDSGESVCLLGPNGAGKSTVLKAIAKLATVHGGLIYFRGRDITSLHTHELLELGIAFVPQGRINFSSMSVLENLEMGGFLLDHAHTRSENIAFVLERFPALKEKIRQTASTLSGGEAQMLAIARALVMRPSFLLLDEPSLGLAPKTVAGIFDNLRQMVADGMTILLVEQNVHLALELATRGYLLAGGRIAFAGSALELKAPDRMRKLYLGTA
ncbi:ABC transporter ATP-binding protein [Patescibacteria group bacterium]|nr:MAG: ABC transporter ATP-binding protein [Patescibacteria group bacterium]